MAEAAKKSKVMRYFRETRAEMKKVSWPSKKDVIKHTQVVIISIVFVGVALWLIDLAFGSVLNFLIKK